MAPRNDMRTGDATNFRLLGTAFLVFAFATSLLSCGKKEEKKAEIEVVRPVKLMTVASGREALDRSLPGSVRASKRVELAFQVEGTLIELPVQEGQSVKQGDLLARLDPRDFEAALRNAESQVERAQALLRLATVEHERLERVKKADPGAVAQSNIDRSLERKAMAQADLQSSEAALDTAKLQLSYTYLKPPFSGVVSSRSVDNFQEVRAKQTVFTLDDLSVIEVLVEVPESLMAPVRSPGTYAVYAEFAPVPGKRYPLTLKEYATRGDPKTLTYQVTFQMPQPKEKINILPGMTANVIAEPKKGTVLPIVIPAVAVFSQQGGPPHVWVVKPEAMTVHLRKVKTGDLTGADGIEIVEGLQRGETIAVSAVSHLREGMKVKKLEE
jgi:multidrug efflux system membrane fusion protein